MIACVRDRHQRTPVILASTYASSNALVSMRIAPICVWLLAFYKRVCMHVCTHGCVVRPHRETQTRAQMHRPRAVQTHMAPHARTAPSLMKGPPMAAIRSLLCLALRMKMSPRFMITALQSSMSCVREVCGKGCECT